MDALWLIHAVVLVPCCTRLQLQLIIACTAVKSLACSNTRLLLPLLKLDRAI